MKYLENGARFNLDRIIKNEKPHIKLFVEHVLSSAQRLYNPQDADCIAETIMGDARFNIKYNNHGFLHQGETIVESSNDGASNENYCICATSEQVIDIFDTIKQKITA